MPGVGGRIATTERASPTQRYSGTGYGSKRCPLRDVPVVARSITFAMSP